jgi:hypothetical protein
MKPENFRVAPIFHHTTAAVLRGSGDSAQWLNIESLAGLRRIYVVLAEIPRPSAGHRRRADALGGDQAERFRRQPKGIDPLDL